MSTPSSQYISAINAGLAALKRGDAQLARQTFATLIDQSAAPASAYVGSAMAKMAMKEMASASIDLDRALALEPRNLWALVLKGDCCMAAGDSPAAIAHYLTATRLSPAREQLPSDLAIALDRAESTCRSHQHGFELVLQSRLKALQQDHGPLSDRFTESVEVLLGRRQIFHSSPRNYYFPGLPSIAFHDKQAFHWVSDLEAQTANIREEVATILHEGGGFRPYIESREGFPNKPQDGLLDNPDWSAFYLWKNGELVSENALRCPKTMEALQAIPLTSIPNRSPSVLFSMLRPGAHIPPHCGLVNTRLICHLPLIVPQGCEFRVGNETRPWREGECWLFDDTIEHEAWNRSTETRVILLLEVWRPELSEHEMSAIRTIFESVDAHSGTRPAWEI